MDPLYLKEFRKKKKLNQKDFAKMVGISQQMISAYELGKKTLSLEKYREIKAAFGYKDYDSSRLRFMIDYLRLTFKSVRDLEHFTKTFLLCPFKEFTSYETKLMNYNHLWKRGDIWIFDYQDKFDTNNYQITVQLSGQGCRQLEVLLEHYDVSWFDFLHKMREAYADSMHVTRLDIAIDEMYLGYDRREEQFELNTLIQKYYNQELDFEKMKTWNYIGGGSLHFDEDDFEDTRQGISLYFGSRQSEMYFNFYEKRYEYAKKERISLEEALEIFEVWNRYEVRLSHGKADVVVDEFLSGVDLAEIARGLINSRIDVFDGTNSYGAYLADQKWQALFGGVEPLHLTLKPEPYDIRRTIKWLEYQVSDTLAMVNEYDKIVGEDNLKMILESGEINDRAEKILFDVQVNVGMCTGEYDVA